MRAAGVIDSAAALYALGTVACHLRLLPERALTRVDALRVLPTRRGALVVFGQAERVLAVPVDCLP